ncbi:unnamed protein product [Brassica oleracea var. botrytis]
MVLRKISYIHCSSDCVAEVNLMNPFLRFRFRRVRFFFSNRNASISDSSHLSIKRSTIGVQHVLYGKGRW